MKPLKNLWLDDVIVSDFRDQVHLSSSVEQGEDMELDRQEAEKLRDWLTTWLET